MPRAIEDPILAYTAAEGEINQIQWGATQPDWIGTHLYTDSIKKNFMNKIFLQPSATTRIWRSFGCELALSLQFSSYICTKCIASLML